MNSTSLRERLTLDAADGIISIGSLNLATETGDSVGRASVNGPASRVAGYPKILQEAIQSCASL